MTVVESPLPASSQRVNLARAHNVNARMLVQAVLGCIGGAAAFPFAAVVPLLAIGGGLAPIGMAPVESLLAATAACPMCASTTAGCSGSLVALIAVLARAVKIDLLPRWAAALSAALAPSILAAVLFREVRQGPIVVVMLTAVLYVFCCQLGSAIAVHREFRRIENAREVYQRFTPRQFSVTQLLRLTTVVAVVLAGIVAIDPTAGATAVFAIGLVTQIATLGGYEAWSACRRRPRQP